MTEICTPTPEEPTFTEFSTIAVFVDNCQAIFDPEKEIVMDLVAV